jgi:hypothetical protein
LAAKINNNNNNNNNNDKIIEGLLAREPNEIAEEEQLGCGVAMVV